MSGSGITRGRVSFAVLTLPLLVVTVSMGLAGPAAADPGERVTSYDVDFEIRTGGVVHVEETIGYDFGANAKHGIYREVPSVERDSGGRYRRYDMSGVTVSSPDGAPSRLEVTESGDDKRIRIGDPARTVTGRHTYVIGYDLTNALTAQSGHEEFYWDAVGDGWEVPVSDIDVEVRTPATVTGAVCYAGAAGSRDPCGSATPSGRSATFTHSGLDPAQGLTIAVKIPKGSVTVPPPVYTDGPDDGDDDSGGIVEIPLPVQVVIAVVMLALIPAAYLFARPRRSAAAGSGSAPGPGPGSAAGPQPLPEPPEGVRPGPAGVLLSGRASAQHVVATLVDLAARGHLRIDELDGGSDWGFARGRDPDSEVSPQEWTLLSALFRGRDMVRMSSLKYAFAGTMAHARRQIIAETVRRGWFRRRPDVQRTVMNVVGGLGTVGAYAMLQTGTWVLAGALLITGVSLLVMGFRLVPLTATGDDLRRRVDGFRVHLSMGPVPAGSGGIGGDLQAAVSTQLPYAIALGVADGWASRFATMAAGPLQVPWYSGRSYPGDPYFASRFTAFTASASSTMAATRSSSSGGGSSSGFSGGSSGGGGGGGGGGSW